MKKPVILFLFVLSLGCDSKSETETPYAPSPGKSISQKMFPSQNDAIEHQVHIFPDEISFGDTLYIIGIDENNSDQTIKDHVAFNLSLSTGMQQSMRASLSLPNTEMKYEWNTELPSNVLGQCILGNIDLPSGEKRVNFRGFLECPPLEDQEMPFWEQLREKASNGKIPIEIEINYSAYDSRRQFRQVVIKQKISIKLRPESEMRLLDLWFKNTDKNLFYRVGEGVKLPNDDLMARSRGRSDINLNMETKLYPGMFIRTANRKPTVPNNPTTISGWRKLEASLIPSTMRDEVRLTRLQLEYYDAANEHEEAKPLKALVDWLESLPRPEKLVMVSSVFDHEFDSKYPRLLEKYQRLKKKLKTLY